MKKFLDGVWEYRAAILIVLAGIASDFPDKYTNIYYGLNIAWSLAAAGYAIFFWNERKKNNNV